MYHYLLSCLLMRRCICMLIKNLTLLDSSNRYLLKDFSFSLGAYDKVGIIGEEGNGKSTLLKAIYQPSSMEDYAGMKGSIDTQNQKFGYFAQQMESGWDSVFIWEYLLKPEIYDDIKDYNELSIYEKECLALHMDPQFISRNQTIASLSGGEKVKLRLLKVLHTPCDVLLLDEPTNDLDIETLEWLERLLKDLKKPVLFISHDETLLQNCANVIIHMEQRNKKTKCYHTIYRGHYEDYIALRYAKIETEQQLAKKEKSEYQKKKQKLNDIQNAVHDALNDTVRNPGLAASLKRKMGNLKAMDKRLEAQGYAHVDTIEEAIDVYFPTLQASARKRILNLQDINVYAGDRMLVEHVKLEVMGKDKIVISGNNGCGKTLFIKKIYDQLKIRKDIRLGYMPQNYSDGFSNSETPISFMMTEGDQKDITVSRELLGRMKFTTDEMEHSIYHLSEGQKAKLYILKFIKQGCDVLLLDEPTRNLSPLTNPVIRHILKQYNGCIISISHDRKYIDDICEIHYVIQKGEWIQR